MGSKNHEVVPTSLINSIANLRGGGIHKVISQLAKNNLIARVQNTKYDGYRLTYGGFDYLALKAFVKRGSVSSVGNQIGVGKESDIYIVADDDGNELVLKIQRLGRVSFRSIKNKRDYLKNRKTGSWMYMSRLAAMKEYTFMQVLYDHGEFPVPKPIDQSRHCIVMSKINGTPLYQVSHVEEPGKLYAKLMHLIVRLAECGLIHGDFNEFNLLLTPECQPVIIDFPQMVSTLHPNAEEYFSRDVDCVRIFFKKRFHYDSDIYPKFSDVKRDEEALDRLAEASGFTKEKQKQYEQFVKDEQDLEQDLSSESEYNEELVTDSEDDEQER